jgi:hypothetical protein
MHQLEDHGHHVRAYGRIAPEVGLDHLPNK